MPYLGVNIDHVATLRQQRREFDPDPVKAAHICQEAGADSIVAHLREDRRHINDRDIIALKKSLRIRFNLEMSVAPDVVNLACKIRPNQVTLVPERRQELTTEGGLDVIKNTKKLKLVCSKLRDKGVLISLFLDPEYDQIDASRELGISILEFHTGRYAAAETAKLAAFELKKLNSATQYARSLGVLVNAGHGLKYNNTEPIARIEGMHELNIGHAIISHAIFVGLNNAVKEMKSLCNIRGI